MPVLSPKSTVLLNPLIAKDQSAAAALAAGPVVPPLPNTLSQSSPGQGSSGFLQNASGAFTAVTSAVQSLLSYVNSLQSALRNFAPTLKQLFVDASDLRAMEHALTLANGANNDIVPGTSVTSPYAFLKVSGPTGAFSVSGFQGGLTKNIQYIWLWNTTSQTMTIKNKSGSQAANQIQTNTGADVVLRTTAPSFATFLYSPSAKLWVLVSTN